MADHHWFIVIFIVVFFQISIYPGYADREYDPNMRKNLIQRYMKVPECSDMVKIYILSERLILDNRTIKRFMTGNFDW